VIFLDLPFFEHQSFEVRILLAATEKLIFMSFERLLETYSRQAKS
jgi:hypothetical protein